MVAFWIIVSTVLVATGWILSAVHELNAFGYGVAGLMGMVAAAASQFT